MAAPLKTFIRGHTFGQMDSLDSETVERIPWETLEPPKSDRQWLVYAVSGAVVVGALSYSFFSNRAPVTEVPPPAPVVAQTTVQTLPEPVPGDAALPAAASPVVVAEADLFAADADELRSAAVAHAMWFAVEFMAHDGSDVSRDVLSSLLPSGVPLPEAVDGAQVFVDFSEAIHIRNVAPAQYQVDVLIRSLVADSDGVFTRVPPRVVGVLVGFDDQGRAQVQTAPNVRLAEPPSPFDLGLTTPPHDLDVELAEGETILGGLPGEQGGWRLVVMRRGVDGISRPTLLEVP